MLVAGGLLAGLLLASCSGTTGLVAPSGPPVFDFQGGDGRLVRVAAPFADHRPPPDCAPPPPRTHGPGRRRTRKPPIRNQLGCSEAPLFWMAHRLGEGLEHAGFTVVDPQATAAGEIVEISGSFRSLELEGAPQMALVFFESDVQIDLLVETPSGLRARRTFFVKSSRSRLGGATATYQSVLQDATDRAVRDMTAAVISLLNRYPWLGRPDPIGWTIESSPALARIRSADG